MLLWRVSSAGTTTITCAAGGMPSASSRRGRWVGFNDSPTSRFTSATTISHAGHHIRAAATTESPRLRGATSPVCPSSHATSATLPQSTTARYSTVAIATPLGRQRPATPGLRPIDWRSAVLPLPLSQCADRRSSSAPVSAPVVMACRRARATADSLCPLSEASRSMLCSVVVRDASSSASNTGEPSITCVERLQRATVVAQSAVPMSRSAVTALPRLIRSAACEACSCICSATTSGTAVCSQVCRSARLVFWVDGRAATRLCESWARNTPSTPRCSISTSSSSARAGVKLAMRCAHRLARSRAALWLTTRSARRRRFSTSTTRKVVGRAQSSPRLSSRTSW